MFSRVHRRFLTVAKKVLIWYSVSFFIHFLHGLICQRHQSTLTCCATACLVMLLTLKTDFSFCTTLILTLLASYFLPVWSFLYLIDLQDEELLQRWDLFREIWVRMYQSMWDSGYFSLAFLLMITLLTEMFQRVLMLIRRQSVSQTAGAMASSNQHTVQTEVHPPQVSH